jgi:hypothetical protein
VAGRGVSLLERHRTQVILSEHAVPSGRIGRIGTADHAHPRKQASRGDPTCRLSDAGHAQIHHDAIRAEMGHLLNAMLTTHGVACPYGRPRVVV